MPAPSSADLHRPSLHHAGGGLCPHHLRAHYQQGAGRQRWRRRPDKPHGARGSICNQAPRHALACKPMHALPEA
jgi:hypothetical protein